MELNMFLKFFLPALGVICAILAPWFLLWATRLMANLTSLLRSAAISYYQERTINNILKSTWRVVKTEQPPNPSYITLILQSDTGDQISVSFERKETYNWNTRAQDKP